MLSGESPCRDHANALLPRPYAPRRLRGASTRVKLMHEVTADIPRAVDQIFEGMDVDETGCISEGQWEAAWQNFPELLDMMSLRGLAKTAHWAAIVLDQVVAASNKRALEDAASSRSPDGDSGRDHE